MALHNLAIIDTSFSDINERQYLPFAMVVLIGLAIAQMTTVLLMVLGLEHSRNLRESDMVLIYKHYTPHTYNDSAKKDSGVGFEMDEVRENRSAPVSITTSGVGLERIYSAIPCRIP
jgi:hypothetical protein